MIEKIEYRLRELIPARDESIFEAARYSLLASGKRIRPLLTLAAAASFGIDPLIALDPACAIEMIHTYSLIHDDLPCMDNDDLRRGRPSLHKVYGEGMALLAGDYLLTFAFEVIASAQNLEKEVCLQMLQILARRSSAPGLIGGQAIDIDSLGKEIDEETLHQMHEGKTSSLFIACLELGSLAAGYPPTPLLQSIGRDLGLIYQFQDDLFNATSTTIALGKQTGSDAEKCKSTAVSLFGVEGVQQKLNRLEIALFEKLQKLPNQKKEDLEHFIRPILKRKF